MYAVRLENDGGAFVAVQVVKTDVIPIGWVASEDKVALGSTYSGGVFTPPDGSAGVTLASWRASTVATRLELGRGMKALGMLTDAETLAFVAYSLPAPIVTLILTLPAEVQAEATLAMTGAQEFPRADAMWDLLAAGPGWATEENIDVVFGWTG